MKRVAVAALAAVVACAVAVAAGARNQDNVTVTVFIAGNGTGSVTIAPTGTTCTQSCHVEVAEGTTIKVTATAGAGSATDNWSSGVCQEQGNNLQYVGPTCTFVASSSMSVTASFAKETLTVFFGGNGGGSVTSSPAGINCTANCHFDFAKGQKVTLTAKPNPDSGFDGWSSGTCAEQGNAQSYLGTTCTVTLTNGVGVSVSFAKSTVSIFFGAPDTGKVVSTPAGLDCTDSCRGQFPKYSTVKLTAQPASGYTIDSWSSNVCAEQGSALSYRGATCTFKVDHDYGISIFFKKGTPSAAGGGGTIGSSTPPPPPVAGRSVNVETDSGTVLVKRPGDAGFLKLQGEAQVPVGSTVDATKGNMGMTSAEGNSNFTGGQFRVTEPLVVGGKRVTSLALTGGNFSVCTTKKTKRHTAAHEAAPKIVRKLFGNGKGNFRSIGKFAAATVRGTIWRVYDRCDGTYVVVVRGVVAVNDLKKHKVVVVKAGHSYLAH